MKKMILMTAILLGSASAFANIAIECGKSVDQDGVVSQTQIMISSEDGEAFKAYNSTGKLIRNANISQLKNGDIVVEVAIGSGMGGIIGNKYVIKYWNGDITTTADKIAVGGFAGGTKVGTLQCVVSEL